MRLLRSVTQKTVARRVNLSGVGVHGGKPVAIALCPADPDTGIVFVRTDAGGTEIPALASWVGATELCTLLGDPAASSVATVEHLLAAVMGLGIDNLVIEIDGAEVPVMDGSAASFVAAMDQAGIVTQDAPRRFIRILKPVRVDAGAAFAEFRPYDGCRFEAAIEYDSPIIGQQSIGLDLTPTSFRRQIARARTFGFMRDVERLWSAGHALGSSLDNSVVIGENGVLNPEGLRFPDEFVRHKVLDAIGDLALLGAPIQGCYRSFRGGHKLNAAAVDTLLARRDAWTYVTPARRRSRGEGAGEIAAGRLAPAYAPR